MRRHAVKHSPDVSGTAAAPSDRARSWLMGATAALFVGRPLLPSEAGAWLGDGQPWAMLWIVLAALVLMESISRGRLAARPGLVDLAVLALVAWQAVSAGMTLSTGSPRPTVNMLWEWVGMGASYFSRGS